MNRKAKIQVLSGFKPLARTLTVYNSEQYDRSNSPQEIGVTVLLAAGFTMLQLSLVIMMVVNILKVIDAELDWTVRAFHLALMLGQIQQFLIAASMTRENRQIADAFEHLQRIVESRK